MEKEDSPRDSPVEGEIEVGQDDREETEQSLRYPGLDKRHGFFLSIANNQSARDSYHWKKEEEKWKRKQEIDDQIQQQKEERRKKKRERQKPDRQVYRPPHHRKEATPTTVNYRIDIEVHPKTYWRREVSQLGQAGELVKAAAEQFRLDEDTKIVLEDILNDFERKLKIHPNH